MASTGLGALTEGFQGGYKFSTDNRRKKQIEKALDYELEGLHNKTEADKADMAKYTEEGGLDPLSKFSGALPQTYGEKLRGWAAGKLGFGKKPQAALDTGAPVEGSGPQMSPAPQQGNPFEMSPELAATKQRRDAEMGQYADGGLVYMRDGGAVRHYANGGRSIMPDRSSGMRDHRRSTASQALPVGYADGGRAGHYVDPETGVEFIDGVPQGEVDIDGGGGGEFAKDVGRAILPNTRKHFNEAIDNQEVYERRLGEADGAANKGRAFRDVVTEGAKGLAHMTGGVMEDTGVGPAIRGVGGFLGYGTDQAEDDEKAAAIRAIDTNAPAQDVAADVAAQPAPGPAAGASQGSPVGAAAPAAQGEEEYDWAGVSDVMPEDMPSHSTKDWAKERAYAARQAVARGENPIEAMKGIDDMQMRGFNQHGQQAFQLLRAGNAPAAARALKAAYQYFPNGVDVRFGIQTGVDGQKVLIGMGVDEETGDPIKEGKPQVITAESLSVQLENMSNPAAFRTWTKDWHATEQAIRKYTELETPKAQADLDNTLAQTQYYKDKGLAAILAARSSGGKGGMKQADYDRAFSQFSADRELQALLGGEDEATARDLTAAMSSVYMKRPGDYPGVIKFVMDSYEQGGMEQVESDLVEFGIL